MYRAAPAVALACAPGATACGATRSTGWRGAPRAGSPRRIAATPGVLRLVLEAHAAYRWAFLSTSGRVLDGGVG